MNHAHHPDQAAEIVSLNDDDLQIEELERRLELALLDPLFDCGSNRCNQDVGDCTTNNCDINNCQTHSGTCGNNSCTFNCRTYSKPIKPVPPKN